MFNYMKADLYRIACKKNMYVWLTIMLSFMLLGLYMGKDGLNAESLETATRAAFTFFWIIGGSYLLSTVYGDDLKSKTLPSIVGFGNSRAAVVIVKLLINVLLTSIILSIAALSLTLMVMFFGVSLDSTVISTILKTMMVSVLTGIGYSSVAMLVGYCLQQSTLAIVFFVLINSNLVMILMNYILEKLNLTDLMDYLLNPIVTKLLSDVSVWTILPYVVYVTVVTVLTVVIFKQRDLDF